MQNPSVLLSGPGQVAIKDLALPEITDANDVIIRIAYTGVCGSDVHFWRSGGIRACVSADAPLVMGHEASGTIHAVGPSATHLFAPGDRVAIEPGVSCRTCQPCKAGRYNLCPRMRFAADPASGTHGTLSRFFKSAADFCYRLPDGVGLRDGVLIEPLAVAVHAVRLAGILGEPGKKVVVFGAGTVGLFCAAVAREFGAAAVVSVDLLPAKLQVARRLVGEDTCRTWVPDGSLSPVDNAEKLKKECGLSSAVVDGGDDGEGGAHVVLEATGAEVSVQTSIYTLRPGGVYVQVGMGKRNIDFPIAEIGEREITVKGCFRYGPGDFAIAMDLVARGKISLDGLVTGEFAFDKAWEAWESTGRGEGIKNVISGPGA
ncbi:chaperonin 10-like protein [Microdochium trichocladiopsis]|uniref:L-arabinitol 4-dehydrogenase n=1 Tax=Microdochium trichocladiopsis TaxID=1682393 RepID=A0A9P8Y515_9PEZI|nr:chaperonin 10-like protein [Microdochium trichocladiopsis]KAH7029494.1 chaperonin 10-like protein [Microdochium trichocladiopsis]